MTPLMNRTKILLGFLLAAVFLYLFLRNMDPQQLWSEVRRGDPSWLILCGVLGFFNYFVRSYRWGFFFEPIKKTSLNNLFRTTVIGFALNTIFPAKIGEVIRPYLLGSKENISKSTAMATVVVERVFDSAAILLFLTVYLLLLVQP